MKTKFIYVILAVLLMGSQMTLSAQNTDNKQKKQRPTPEQMVQMQTKQIVNTLMLDDATAAKFTPVYEKYLKELRECRMMTHKARTEKTKGQGTDGASIAWEILINCFFSSQRKSYSVLLSSTFKMAASLSSMVCMASHKRKNPSSVSPTAAIAITYCSVSISTSILNS